MCGQNTPVPGYQLLSHFQWCAGCAATDEDQVHANLAFWEYICVAVKEVFADGASYTSTLDAIRYDDMKRLYEDTKHSLYKTQYCKRFHNCLNVEEYRDLLLAGDATEWLYMAADVNERYTYSNSDSYSTDQVRRTAKDATTGEGCEDQLMNANTTG